MGQLRDLARRVAGRLARTVAKDDLFEKPGERPKTAPLPEKPAATGTAGSGPGATAKVPASAPAAAASAIAPGEPPAPTGHKAPASAPAAAASVVVHTAAAAAPDAAPSATATAPAATEPAAGRAPAKKANAAEKPVAAARPKDGCAPVDVEGLRAALTPSGKPLVINHWATWCDPCVDELPRLVRAAAGVADLGEFLGVSWDLFDHPGKPATVAKKVAQFADGAGVGYPSVLFTGKPEELFEACGLDFEQIPQTLVLAPDGRVVYHKKGVIDHDDVFPLIEAVKGARG